MKLRDFLNKEGKKKKKRHSGVPGLAYIGSALAARGGLGWGSNMGDGSGTSGDLGAGDGGMSGGDLGGGGGDMGGGVGGGDGGGGGD